MASWGPLFHLQSYLKVLPMRVSISMLTILDCKYWGHGDEARQSAVSQLNAVTSCILCSWKVEKLPWCCCLEALSYWPEHAVKPCVICDHSFAVVNVLLNILWHNSNSASSGRGIGKERGEKLEGDSLHSVIMTQLHSVSCIYLFSFYIFTDYNVDNSRNYSFPSSVEQKPKGIIFFFIKKGT